MVLKTVFTLVCFFAYGAATEEVVSANYTKWAAQAVSILIVANTWLSFPLPLIPVFRWLDCTTTGTEGGRSRLARVGLRTLVRAHVRANSPMALY